MSLLQLRADQSNHHDFGSGMPLDLVFLSRQTMGDVKIERDLLALFKVQCQTCRDLLTRSDVSARTKQEKMNSEIALRMKNSANAVGAWEIVKTALALENAPLETNHINALAHEIEIVETYLVSIS